MGETSGSDPIAEAVDDAIATELDLSIEEEFDKASLELRELAVKVFAGTATPEDLEEYHEGLKEVLGGWVSLVTQLFSKFEVHPVSPEAVDFYTIMDIHRVLVDMDPRSPDLIGELAEMGVIGNQENDTND